jgi:hypothetical protein
MSLMRLQSEIYECQVKKPPRIIENCHRGDMLLPSIWAAFSFTSISPDIPAQRVIPILMYGVKRVTSARKIKVK